MTSDPLRTALTDLIEHTKFFPFHVGAPLALSIERARTALALPDAPEPGEPYALDVERSALPVTGTEVAPAGAVYETELGVFIDARKPPAPRAEDGGLRAALDVDRLADIAVMALGEVTTGAAYGLYHKSFREHFVARLSRADEYRALAAPEPPAGPFCIEGHPAYVSGCPRCEDNAADIRQASTGGPDFTPASWPEPPAGLDALIAAGDALNLAGGSRHAGDAGTERDQRNRKNWYEASVAWSKAKAAVKDGEER